MNDINNINNLFREVIQEQSEEPRYNNSMKERIEWLIDYYTDMRNEAEADQHSNPYAIGKQIDMCQEFIQDLKDLHKEL